MNTLGERLRKLRLGQDLTQDEVATRLNVSRATYANWEIGRSDPDSATLEGLADVFEVSTDYLLGREGLYGAPVANWLEQLPEDVREFITDAKNGDYLKVIKDMAADGITPDALRSVIAAMIDFRQRPTK